MAVRSSRLRQRGWVGLVVILIALVIVAVMAQTALKSYGLLPGPERSSRADRQSPATRATPAEEATAPAAAPANPIARARGLEEQVQRDAQDQARRIDESTK